MRRARSARNTVKFSLWAAASLAVLGAAALLLFASLGLFVWLRSGGPPDEVQLAAWRALGGGVVRQAILPQLGLAFALWVVVLRRYEGRRMLPWLFGAALAAFPPVGLLGFTMWQPGSVWDVASTWLLLALAVTFLLALPRRLLPGLGAGAFARLPDGDEG